MAITFFGVSSTPADNSTSTNPVTITPPASMVAGDLAVVVLNHKSSGNWSIVEEGGQTWTALGASTSGSTIARVLYWCRYNGTWSADPTFSNSAGGSAPATGVMTVFRPTNGANTWTGYEVSNSGANATTTLVTFGSFTPTNANSVTLGTWLSSDNNTWGNLTGTGWSKSGLSNQYRNSSGQDNSITLAYYIQGTVEVIPEVSQTQLTLGADNTLGRNFNFYETSAAVAGILKRWNGSTWVKAKLKSWNGSTWVLKPTKIWTGSAWEEIDTTGV